MSHGVINLVRTYEMDWPPCSFYFFGDIYRKPFSLMLTLSRFHALFWDFYFWLCFWLLNTGRERHLNRLIFTLYIFAMSGISWSLTSRSHTMGFLLKYTKTFYVEVVSITLQLIFIFIGTIHCFQNTFVLFCMKNKNFYIVPLISYVTLISCQCDNVKVTPYGIDLHLALS